MWLKSDGKGDGLPIRAVGATAVGITGMFVGASRDEDLGFRLRGVFA